MGLGHGLNGHIHSTFAPKSIKLTDSMGTVLRSSAILSIDFELYRMIK